MYCNSEFILKLRLLLMEKNLNNTWLKLKSLAITILEADFILIPKSCRTDLKIAILPVYAIKHLIELEDITINLDEDWAYLEFSHAKSTQIKWDKVHECDNANACVWSINIHTLFNHTIFRDFPKHFLLLSFIICEVTSLSILPWSAGVLYFIIP